MPVEQWEPPAFLWLPIHVFRLLAAIARWGLMEQRLANLEALRSLLDGKEAVGIGIFQAPGSNALAISDRVRETMAELKKSMPEGVDYAIAYDPTQFVRASIRSWSEWRS